MIGNILQALLIGVVIGVFEVLKNEFRNRKLGMRGMFLLMGIGIVFVSISLFLTTAVLVSVTCLFVVYFYRFLKEFTKEIFGLEEKREEVKQEEKRFDIWKVMSSPDFPQYNKELAMKFIQKALGGDVRGS